MATADGGKAAWRRLAAEMFRLVPREARRAFDAALCERLYGFARRRGARFILGFAPLPDEPDIAAFLRRWLGDGSALALPVWLGGSTMMLRRVDDLDRQLVAGRGGIFEPAAGLPETDPASLDLVVTPGRAFSESGVRLGRGAGCYDELFRNFPGLARAGAAYDFQVFPEIPADDNDIPVDAVITPSRIVGET